ncbi:MAG TPA: hypothetical protein VMV19_17565 [Xanthobacteraceae bacterium]|nr:hypothetical protein [Xanthobacteraceae bacterium]
MATPQRSAVRVSTATQARAALTAHVFRPGGGYFAFSTNANNPVLATAGHFKPWMLAQGSVKGGTCLPPDKTVAGSAHFLKPPGGAQPLVFIWIAGEAAWAPLYRDGKRMAFNAAYLASHGWIYLKPVETSR